MEKFEKDEEEKLRAESMMDEATHNRSTHSKKEFPSDNIGNVFLSSQRMSELYKDFENTKNELKITKISENIENRNELVEELKEKRKSFEIFAKDKEHMEDALKTIEEIDQMIKESEIKNEIDSIENEGLINKKSSNKTKPEENIWKN